MRVLMLCINDPAGSVIAMCRALERHTAISARMVTLETRYTHNFQRDIHIPDAQASTLEELQSLFQHSDIFHFHMTADEHTPFGPFLPADFLHGKTLVHHHHGHPDFRAYPHKYEEKYRLRGRRNLLVSTPDLLRLLPEARWQPNLVPQDAPLYRPLPVRPHGPLRIGHSPTQKALKNTDAFVQVTADLAADVSLPPNEPMLIDDIPHERCLKMKQTADIFFDHMHGYYGISSLEALSQGVPTIAGLDAWNQAHIEQFFQKTPPWILAQDEAGLRRCCRELLLDEDLRREKGQESRQFMEQAWTEARLAQHLASFYKTAEA